MIKIEGLVGVIKEQIDIWEKEGFDKDELLILLGKDTYKIFIDEVQSLMSKKRVVMNVVSDFLGVEVMLVDRDSYFTVVKRSDVIGNK